MNKSFKFFIIILFAIFTAYPIQVLSVEKIKIGLLVPLTGDDKKIGYSIIKSSRI